jgi:hypothetical protein
VGNYITADEVKCKKIGGVVVEQVKLYTDAEIEEEIAFIEQWIELITGDIFYTKIETNEFDGNGLTRLFFPPDIPYQVQIENITSVKDFDTDGLLLDTFIEGEDFVPREFFLEIALSFPEDTPRRGILRGGVWPRGQKNIHIEASWGLEETPGTIKKAACLLVLEKLIPGSTGMAPQDVIQAVWPDFTISYKSEKAFGMTTGFAEVDRLLMLHLNHSSLFLVVPDTKQTYDNNLFGTTNR